ncbi:efflux RND transporter periplasmic adaptor subunit [Xylophilus rhododendri]|uniref:Efflux RND transporter periplasmic adaptor subunit n=1 Tax=Xylophilus rhododendri TaxID=2697032 RepID=A0A857J496_9BURK|nr:efflux RND transporter periplasmic adaptor subunit [Xylophilus rhododendri]QHI97872.1 efflux RND transporter periplasmic adaptor subunit [Xylophilus rhododendri]
MLSRLASWRKRPIRILFILLVLAAIGWFVRQHFFVPPPPPQYVTAAVTRGDLEDSVLATGTLQAFKQVSVGAQVSGQVKTLAVKLGDPVKKGDLIAEIDSVPQQNTLRNAEAALNSVKAQLAAQQATLLQAQLNFRRQQQLLAGEAGSQLDFETAQATYESAKATAASLTAQIAQAGITADTARVNLGYTRIVAPIDGQVVAIVTQQGQTVNANQTTPTIVKVAQLDTVTVKSQISEADVVKVKPGQKVYFTILGEPDNRYYATLRTVEPAPDSILTDTTTSSSTSTTTSTTAVYYNGLFDVANPEGKLRISMTAQVSIVRGEAKNALTIPTSALGPRGPDGGYRVRVVGADGTAQPRQVKTGINNNVSVQVTEGLAEGDRVVLGDASARDPAQTMRRGPGGPPRM